MNKLTLNPEVKELWTKALKSGDYKQGTGTLHNSKTDTFCCLGVLCDLHRKKSKKGKSAWKPGMNNLATFYKGSHTSLPLAVVVWAFGEKSQWASCPFVLKDKKEQSLIRLNDSDKLPFTEIAALIEKHL